jgi:hypothetical protein
MSLADFVPCPSVQPGPAPYAGSVMAVAAPAGGAVSYRVESALRRRGSACRRSSISPETSERNDVHAMYRAVRAQSAGRRCSQTDRKSPHDVDHASDG